MAIVVKLGATIELKLPAGLRRRATIIQLTGDAATVQLSDGIRIDKTLAEWAELGYLIVPNTPQKYPPWS